MREKIQRFMIGRYGADELAKAQSIAALVLLFLSMFSRLGIFYWLAIALMIYSTWRMFSKNISARYAENQKYLALENRLRRFWGQKRYLIQQRKEYHIYKCPGCKQKIRIPRGKGKISIPFNNEEDLERIIGILDTLKNK